MPYVQNSVVMPSKGNKLLLNKLFPLEELQGPLHTFFLGSVVPHITDDIGAL